MESLFATQTIIELAPKIRAFIEREIYPLETAENLGGKFSALVPTLKQKRELVRQNGWWGLSHRLTLCEFGQISEILGSSPFGHYVFNCQAPDIGNMELLEKFGSPEQQKQFLAPLAAGETRSCFAMTEPDFAGSNPTNLGTIATRDGDFYVLNGRKWFTSSADGAAFAIVMAVTNPDELPHRRASQILVPTDTKGYHFIKNLSFMGEASDDYMTHAEVEFRNCRVPVSHRIGAEGSGFLLAQERLGPGRIHHCMRWIGIAERAFDLLCRRARSRAMGDGEVLGQKQFVMGWIADSRAEIDAARLMVLRTARLIDENGAASARNEISSIKFFTANIMLSVVDRAIQAHGAAGLLDDNLLAFWYRHERAARIYDGADEVHKIALAKSILKKYN